MENFQLMTQDDDLELQRGAAPDAAGNAIDERKRALSRGPRGRGGGRDRGGRRSWGRVGAESEAGYEKVLV